MTKPNEVFRARSLGMAAVADGNGVPVDDAAIERCR